MHQHWEGACAPPLRLAGQGAWQRRASSEVNYRNFVMSIECSAWALWWYRSLAGGLWSFGIASPGPCGRWNWRCGRRVVTSHFPEAVHYEDVRSISQADVQQWARDYSQASLVIIGAGPPCQGVSGLNASRKGALRDERSGLFPHVKRIWLLVQDQFPWCQVHCLMESVASMDQQDREVMSQNYGNEPWNCDAGSMTWCHRPRLYWISWELVTQEGVELEPGSPGTPRRANLYALQDLEEVCKEGWIKTDPDRAFPTFTTSRPRDRPGHKPAGLRSCTPQDLDRWAADSFRFPPYQYTAKNLLIDKHDQLRMPSIEEKEYIMGFPVNYTQACLPKAQRGTIHHLDVRHSQIGNTWCVPVIAWLLGQLCGPLGLCPLYTPPAIDGFLESDAPGFSSIAAVESPAAAIAWAGACVPG